MKQKGLFLQLLSEVLTTTYRKGRPHREWIRRKGMRAEALDCLIYAVAARHIVNVNYDDRRAELATASAPAARPLPVLNSSWMAR